MKIFYHRLIKTLTVFSVIMLLPVVFYGQNTDKIQQKFSPYWYMGANIGINQFYGDIQDLTFFDKLSDDKMSVGLNLGHQFTPILGLRGNFKYGSVYSLNEGANREMEASTLLDYNISGTVSILNLISGYNPDRKLDVYAMAGIGFMNWKSELRNSNTGAVLKKHGTSGNGPLELTTEGYIPVGAGISYKFDDKWSLALEQTWNGINSDMLDISEGGYAYDITSNTALNLSYNLGSLSGIRSMVHNYDQVTYEVTPEVLERHGDKVKVTVKGQFPEKYFNKHAAMKFTPVIKYGEKSKTLKTITFKGEKVEGDGQIITAEGGSFTYSDVFTYEDGMENATFTVNPLVYSPKGNPVNNDATEDNIINNYKNAKVGEKTLATGTIITGQRVLFVPGLAYNKDVNTNPGTAIALADGYEKETIISEAANIFFQVNLAYLNWRLPLNVDNNTKKSIDQLKQFIDKGWKIKDIELNAWASPEGEESFNAGLSERRAKTGMKVLKKILRQLDMNIEDINISTQAKGEDWNGFMDAVEASNIKDKNIILNVVRSQQDLVQREQEIRNMALVYEEVEENILPPLRRTNIKVNSFEPKFTDAQISEYSLNDAEKLDSKEMLYAATLTDNLDEQISIYKKTIEMFPKCVKAYNNIAYTYITKGEYSKAEKMLNKAIELKSDCAIAINNLGIVAGINGDFAKAEKLFTKAQKLGVDENYNLAVINITKGEYDKALSLFAGKTCDYNVALTYVVTGDFEKAEKALKCAPESAAKYYLAAIIHSHLGETDGMYKHLIKAIKADAKYKTILKSDKEFAKYANTPDFINLLK